MCRRGPKMEREEEKEEEEEEEEEGEEEKTPERRWRRLGESYRSSEQGKWRFDRLLSHLATTILGYSNEGKPAAFSWPTGAGVTRNIPAIRARVTYDFWKYFISEGRKKLAEHNKNSGSRIEITKEVTMKVTDENNLGLLMRRKLTEIYLEHGKQVPEMYVRKGQIYVGRNIVMKPSMMVLKLGLKLPEWRGVPVLELLNETEQEEYKNGLIVAGSLKLPGLEAEHFLESPTEKPKEGNHGGRKRNLESIVDQSAANIEEPNKKLRTT